ncbi:MAG: response regulator [Syntrophomonas sp.]
MKKIKVLLADDNKHTRSSIRRLLDLDKVIDIVGEANNGEEVINKIPRLEPDIIIMDQNMPGMDGIEATRYITLHTPRISVIMVSINDESQSFQKAMMAGAKAYLIKPISSQELSSTIREVYKLSKTRQELNEPPKIQVGKTLTSSTVLKKQIVSVFGPKGGVGRSVICTNLAVGAAQKYGQPVGLVDLDIQFGDISLMMNLNPRLTIAELVQEDANLNPDILQDYVYERNGVYILPAPNKPELAELVTPDAVDKILKAFKERYNYTFIDTPASIDEITLTALEKSDKIILLGALDIPTIKNIKKGLDILKSLSLLPKAILVLNRSSGVAGIEPRDFEKAMNMKIQGYIPSEGKMVVASVNEGIPFVQMNPKAAVSKSIFDFLGVLNK